MKGYKTCPCGKQVGARTITSPCCGYQWRRPETNEPIVLPEATRTRRAEKKSANPVVHTRLHSVRIPAGANPVPLKGKDKNSLLKWAEEVRAYWRSKGDFLMKEGLCYYLQWEPAYEDNEKAYEAACKVINDNLTDEKP